jgi:parallel beta-helix repeat protein
MARALSGLAITLAVTILAATSSTPRVALAVSPTITITEDFRLDEDLTFAGTGLVVAADNITIDLNGHTIHGPLPGCSPDCPTSLGIQIWGRTGVSVKNGTVRGFSYGLHLSHSDSNEIKAVRSTENLFEGFTILTDSDDNVLKDCEASDNGRFGVMIYANTDGNTVKDCNLTANYLGIMLGAQPLLSPPGGNNTVKGVNASGNARSGIVMLGSDGNLIVGNTANHNGESGIGLGLGANDNVIQGNQTLSNGGAGINVLACFAPFGCSASNTFGGNFMTGNSPDVQDLTTGNGTAGTANTYQGNYCDAGIPAGLCGADP